MGFVLAEHDNHLFTTGDWTAHPVCIAALALGQPESPWVAWRLSIRTVDDDDVHERQQPQRPIRWTIRGGIGLVPPSSKRYAVVDVGTTRTEGELEVCACQ